MNTSHSESQRNWAPLTLWKIKMLALGLFLCQSLLGTDRGYLKVRVFDTEGGELSTNPTVTVFNSAGTPVSEWASSIPYGEYTVRAEASLFGTENKKVLLYEPSLEVIMALPWAYLGDRDTVGYSLVGTIHGFPRKQHALIRVLSAFGDFSKEAPVSEKGAFEVKSLPLGTYVVLLISEVEVVLGGIVSTRVSVALEGTATLALTESAATFEYQFGSGVDRRCRTVR